ncbi:UNVERIFIED_ORG: transposase [Rhizobium esperanzae]|nr:IS66 family insertion sequence element accessory protein TnpB [Rhizobium phaseoli]
MILKRGLWLRQWSPAQASQPLRIASAYIPRSYLAGVVMLVTDNDLPRKSGWSDGDWDDWHTCDDRAYHRRRRYPGRRRYRRSTPAAGDPSGAVGMIPSGVKVFLASHPIDFRKGPDSLLSLVRDAGSDPFNGALYVFRAKRADRVKIVWWDGSGVCLYAKRLEKAQFCWPRIGHHRVQLNHAQLLALVDGMDWKRV